MEILRAVPTSPQLLKVDTQTMVVIWLLVSCDTKEMNKRRLDVLTLEKYYFGSNKHSLLPTGKRIVWLWKWWIFWEPVEGYLRKRRKDIFGNGGSEIPGPCIRRPVAMKVHLIPAQIIHRTPLAFTGDYPETLGLLQ